jgi:CubicO group peptidase (beta-lactamase class C family)
VIRRLVLIALALGTMLVTAAAQTPPPSVYAAAGDAGAGLPRLHSLLVSSHGQIVFERYYRGIRADRPANIKSASKSVISALVGIAIDRGLIKGVSQPVQDFFPGVWGKPSDAPKRAITVEHLLMMQSGLESTSSRNYGAWVRSSNWVSHALARPLLRPPGTEMDYSTGNSHLLSAIVQKASGKTTREFAQEFLAGPLGFTLSDWPRDPQGVYFGGNDMLMTPRQMVTFGELYLRDGLANGRRVVPAEWVRTSMIPRGRSRWNDREYGYGWWIRELGGRPTFYAWGYGGQFIFVVPSVELVVVTTSASTVATERREHLEGIYDIVSRLIVEPSFLRSSLFVSDPTPSHLLTYPEMSQSTPPAATITISQRSNIATAAASITGNGNFKSCSPRSIIQCHAVCATSAEIRIVPTRGSTTNLKSNARAGTAISRTRS